MCIYIYKHNIYIYILVVDMLHCLNTGQNLSSCLPIAHKNRNCMLEENVTSTTALSNVLSGQL